MLNMKNLTIKNTLEGKYVVKTRTALIPDR
jgi:hypothetical protein